MKIGNYCQFSIRDAFILKKTPESLKRGVHFLRILCISPLIINVLGGVHLPPFPQKAIMLLRGRYTRYFQLIINVLYIKRGKSAPPYKNFHEKNTLVIQTSQNLPLHFLELNAKHVHSG